MDSASNRIAESLPFRSFAALDLEGNELAKILTYNGAAIKLAAPNSIAFETYFHEVIYNAVY